MQTGKDIKKIVTDILFVILRKYFILEFMTLFEVTSYYRFGMNPDRRLSYLRKKKGKSSSAIWKK